MTTSRVLLLSGVLIAALSASTEAQANRVVRGRVTAASDTTPVADAVLKLVDSPSSRLTWSSAAGRFQIRVPAGEVRLLVARIGFAPDTVIVGPDVRELTVRLRESTVVLDPITVSAEPVYSAASSRTVRELDILIRPRETAQELLRLAPGLVIAQHAGGGKAEQIFLRGFDADHGTDVAISVDGTPVNMVSHGHGQGYADLHFVIPETVQIGEVRKGPYEAEDGNLATAGAVNFRTRDRIEAPRVEARGGTFSTVHGLAMAPFGGDASRAGGYAMISGHYTDGPTISPPEVRTLQWLREVSPLRWVAAPKWSGRPRASIRGGTPPARFPSGQWRAEAFLVSDRLIPRRGAAPVVTI